jgi:hypothetical protein
MSQMLVPNFKNAMLAIAGLALFGCVVQPRPVTPPAPPVSLSGPFTAPKTAISGQTIKVDFSASINPDCTVRAVPVVRILVPPSHGTASSAEGEDFTSFPLANVRSACNKARSRGALTTYTPAPGYFGPDYMSMEVLTQDGGDRTYNMPITVK